MFLVPARGGAARKLTTFGIHPAWTPDGRDIFFIRQGGGGFARAYLVSPSGDQPPREILSEFMNGGSWEWMAPHPDGRISMIGSHRTHGMGFYTVSRDGRDVTVVKPLASFSGEGHHPTRRFQWTPQANALYVEIAVNQIWTLWRVPVAPTTLQWLSAERLTTGTDNARSPAVSPDGKRIAFASHQASSRASVFPFDPVAGRLQGEGRSVTDEDTMVLWPTPVPRRPLTGLQRPTHRNRSRGRGEDEPRDRRDDPARPRRETNRSSRPTVRVTRTGCRAGDKAIQTHLTKFTRSIPRRRCANAQASERLREPLVRPGPHGAY